VLPFLARRREQIGDAQGDQGVAAGEQVDAAAGGRQHLGLVVLDRGVDRLAPQAGQPGGEREVDVDPAEGADEAVLFQHGRYVAAWACSEQALGGEHGGPGLAAAQAQVGLFCHFGSFGSFGGHFYSSTPQ